MKPDKHKAKRSSAYKKRQNNKGTFLNISICNYCVNFKFVESKNKDPKKVESKPQAHSDDGIEVTSFKKVINLVLFDYKNLFNLNMQTYILLKQLLDIFCYILVCVYFLES